MVRVSGGCRPVGVVRAVPRAPYRRWGWALDGMAGRVGAPGGRRGGRRGGREWRFPGVAVEGRWPGASRAGSAWYVTGGGGSWSDGRGDGAVATSRGGRSCSYGRGWAELGPWSGGAQVDACEHIGSGGRRGGVGAGMCMSVSQVRRGAGRRGAREQWVPVSGIVRRYRTHRVSLVCGAAGPSRRAVNMRKAARSIWIMDLAACRQRGRYWDRTSDLFGVNEALSR